MYLDSLQTGHKSGMSAPQILNIETMTAKGLLDRITKIRKAIDYRKTKIDVLMSQAENTSARLSGMPHSPSADPSPMATAICKKVDLEREIEELIMERNSLIAKIDLLENDELSRLLILRYAQEETWEDVAADMGFCERHTYRLHKSAVEELDSKLKDVI